MKSGVPKSISLEAQRVLVVNDAHLGQDLDIPSRERQSRLIQLLEQRGPQVDLVVLLGDIFEFWFEYRRVIPNDFVPLLGCLSRLRTQTRIVFVEGNHDLWMEDFFPKVMDIPVVEEGVDLRMGETRVWLGHGDLIDGVSLGGQTTRRILGHPWLRECFRWIHPDLGIALAHGVARWNRGRSQKEEIPEPRLVEGVQTLLNRGYRLVVLGHLHEVRAQRVGKGFLMVTGDWMRHFTYGWLESQRWEIRTFPSNEVVARLSPDIP